MWARRVLSHLVEVGTDDPALLEHLEGLGTSQASTPARRRLRYQLVGGEVTENGDWLAAVASGAEAAEVIFDRVVRIVVDSVGRAGWLPLAGSYDPATGAVVLGPDGLLAVRGGRVAATSAARVPDDTGPALDSGPAVEALLAWALPSPLARGAMVGEAAGLLRAGVHVRERGGHAARLDGLRSRATRTGRLA